MPDHFAPINVGIDDADLRDAVRDFGAVTPVRGLDRLPEQHDSRLPATSGSGFGPAP